MDNKPQKQLMKSMSAMSAIVSYLVGPILLGVFGGRWLDRYFQTEPIFMIVGVLAGIATGIFSLIRFLKVFLGDE